MKSTHGVGKNWARNYQYRAAVLHEPETVEQVQELVSRHSKLKVLGTRHCFNDIADAPDGHLISLARLDGVRLDAERRTVTVEGGVRYGELSDYLHGKGWALHNLASLPHISVAGACATATHGSGDGNGNLATAVSAIEFVAASGELVTLVRGQDDEHLLGAVVGLGGLGVITKLTLEVLPTFDVAQDVYENLPLSQLETHFDEITSSAYSISLFTDWQSPRFNQVWRKSRVTEDAAAPSAFFGATAAAAPMHPVGADPSNCTDQMGRPGPWHERLPHFKMGFQPSHGNELQSEYFVAREHAVDALWEIFRFGDRLTDHLWISEIRTVAADELWMSPCYRQASVGIHFTWKDNWPEIAELLPAIEELLAPFNARPHWGKLFTMKSDRLQPLYTRLPDFRRLLNHYDPAGKLRNPFLEQYLTPKMPSITAPA